MLRKAAADSLPVDRERVLSALHELPATSDIDLGRRRDELRRAITAPPSQP
jgi:hypothetical protein